MIHWVMRVKLGMRVAILSTRAWTYEDFGAMKVTARLAGPATRYRAWHVFEVSHVYVGKPGGTWKIVS